MRIRSAVVAPVVLTALAVTAGCGGQTTQEPQAAAAPASVAPTSDPKAEWISGMFALCTDLAGAVSGIQLQARTNDHIISPAEVLAGEKKAAPATAAFDQGFEKLPVTAETAPLAKVWEDYLDRRRASLVSLLAAARAGDQAGVSEALSAREGEASGPNGNGALLAIGLPEKCSFRGSYS